MEGILGRLAQRRVNPGLILSLAIHGLVLLIPVSAILVERYEELELYILNEEKAVIQPHRVVEKKIDTKIIESSKIKVIPREEVKEISEKKEEFIKEELKKVEEEPIKAPMPERIESKAKEPMTPSVEIPSVPLSISAAPLSIEARLPEKTSPLPLSGLPSQIDAGEPVAILKETVHPAPSRVQEVEFGSKEGPKFLRRILPVYPIMARRMGKEGRVLLRLTIDEKGNLLKVEVLEHGGFGFTEAAVEAVKKSSFLPAHKNGAPVSSQALLPIRFNLRSDS